MGLTTALRENRVDGWLEHFLSFEGRYTGRVIRVTNETQEKHVDTQLPRRRSGLVERELPAELILYDPETDRAFLLNRTSAAIWDLCDGQNAIQQIGEELTSHFGATAKKVVEDVEATIERFRHDKLLVPG